MRHTAFLYLSGGFFLGLFVLQFASAADHNGSQLPVSIPQKTFDYVATKGKFDSRGSLTHWTSCGHTLDERNAQLSAAKAALAACEAGVLPGECEKPKFPDGSGGALWKPVAEGGSSGEHSTFLGANDIQKVEILGASGEQVADIKLRYYNGPGGRSVWDTKQAASSLPQNITIRSYFVDRCEDRVVPDPTQRVD